MVNGYKISVIVTVYNTEQYLDKCIGSIIGQSYDNIEIILVNDGSVDNSLEVCRKYERLDERIIIINSKNEGAVAARKKGILRATGDYIAFVDSDDWIDSNMFENITGKSKGEDIISFGLIEEYGHKRVIKRDNLRAGCYLKDELKEKILPNMLCSGKFYKFGIQPNLVCKLIKRKLLIQSVNGISDIVTMGDDGDFVYHALSMADSLRIIDTMPYHYVQRSGSLVRTRTSMEALSALYRDLNNIRLSDDYIMEVWKKQINTYFIFLLLLKNTQMAINKISLFKEKLYGRRVIIYGAGNYGMGMMAALSVMPMIDIIGIADRDWKEISQTNPNVKNIDELLDEEFDMIYIAVLDEDICKSVEDMLLKKQVIADKIFYLRYQDISECSIQDLMT